MQLTKESQKEIEKAAAAMVTTEAKILVDSADDIIPLLIQDTSKTLTEAQRDTLTKKKINSISKSILSKYEKGMIKGKGSVCIERVVEDIGGGKVKIYPRSKFVEWLKDIPRREVTEISKKISDGAEDFKNPRLIAKDLESHFKNTKHRSVVASRTESLKLQNTANINTRKAAGQKYLKYITAGDERVRPEHQLRAGKYYPISNPPDLGEYQCRCTLVDGTLDVMEGAPVEDSTVVIMDKADLKA